MISRDQAEQAADSLLEPSKKKLSANQNKRAKLASRRRESPFIPAVVAAIATSFSLNYFDDVVISMMLGAAIGYFFGWVSRRT